MTESVLVLGLGNTLLTDEGVGVHVMQQLQETNTDLQHIEYVDGGTLSLILAVDVAAAKYLIVIDAAEMQAPPGTVNSYLNEDMDEFLGSNRKRSVHEVGLIDLMAIVALQGRLPARRALIGVQPEITGWGERPSQAVADAIPAACDIARGLIREWRL